MFKRLRNNFLFIHMGIVGLLIILFFIAIFIFAKHNVESFTNEVLNRDLIIKLNQIPNPHNAGDEIRPKLSPTFIVKFDENQNVINVISPFNMEPDFYDRLTKISLSKNVNIGKIKLDNSYFKYIVNENKIIFLDISRDVQMLTNMLYTFFWIAIPMLILIYIISLWFANRSIRPIENSYNKQKNFIADASHEFKTPIATISTNVDVLLDGASSEQTKWLTYIKMQTERMASLTNSLLYLTKIDSVEEKNDATCFNFSNLINDYLMPLEAVFYENKIKTNISIVPNVNILADAEQIGRLISILIDNAIKYSDGEIEISLEKSQNNAKLTVCNTGMSIEKSDLPKIWDRFYRCDKSRQYIGGFGLGLPIAKAIVESYNGTITVESVENQFTKFIVKLKAEY